MINKVETESDNLVANVKALKTEKLDSDIVQKLGKHFVNYQPIYWNTLLLYYRHGKSYTEIARAYGFTREWIRQVLEKSKKILSKIKL